jgi:hypothetical protein
MCKCPCSVLAIESYVERNFDGYLSSIQAFNCLKTIYIKSVVVLQQSFDFYSSQQPSVVANQSSRKNGVPRPDTPTFWFCLEHLGLQFNIHDRMMKVSNKEEYQTRHWPPNGTSVLAGRSCSHSCSGSYSWYHTRIQQLWIPLTWRLTNWLEIAVALKKVQRSKYLLSTCFQPA